MPYVDPPPGSNIPKMPDPKPPKPEKPKALKVVPEYSIGEWKLPEEVQLTIEQLTSDR